jgi:hypothetical protein
MKQPRRPSCRQLSLLMEFETSPRLGLKVQQEAIRVLAELLLEVLAANPVAPPNGGLNNEPQD